MDPIIIYSAISLIAGLVVGVLGFKFGLKSQADAIIKEAKVKGDAIKEKKISQAKQKFFELKEKQKSERKDLDRGFSRSLALLWDKRKEGFVCRNLDCCIFEFARKKTCR